MSGTKKATKEENYMKMQIRRGVFETNSSSVHSLTMCSSEEYDKWKNGEVLYWRDRDKFCTREEIIAELKTLSWYSNVDWDDGDSVYDVFQDEGVKDYRSFFCSYDYETFRNSYTTTSGEKVYAFGFYGYG